MNLISNKSLNKFSEKSGDVYIVSHRLKLNIAFWQLDISNFFLRLCKNILFRRNKNLRSGNISNILIFRTGSMGDTICSFPTIYNIQQNFPNATIDILTNTGNSELVSTGSLLDDTFYDKIIDYLGQNPFLLWKKLRSNKYDLIIQLPQQYARALSQLRDMIFFRTLGIKYGFGWQKSSSLIYKKIQEKYIIQKNETDILLDIISHGGLEIFERYKYPLNISALQTEIVRETLSMSGVNLSMPLIALVIGAKRPQNRWPLSYFKEISKWLLKDGVQILIIGGKEDELNAEKLIEKNVWNFCGKLTPIQSAIAFSLCKLTISNDTGPMHLSYAVGTPVIAIFSSRDFPGRWYPPNNIANKIFRNENVACSLCLTDSCKENICMKGIVPEVIINQINNTHIFE